MDRKYVAEKLTNIFDDTVRELDRLKELDRVEQARNGVMHISADFAYDDNRAMAHSIVTGARERAQGIIDREIKLAEERLVEAPSTEAANYCAAISGRTDMTEDEVNAALAKYADHASQKAIRMAAKASGLLVGAMTETERDIAAMRALRSSVSNTYNPREFEVNSSGVMAAMTRGEYRNFGEGRDDDAMGMFAALGGGEDS